MRKVAPDAAHHADAYPFTGIFRAQGQALSGALTRTQGADLIEVVEQLDAGGLTHYTHVEWIDIGHDIHYPEARSRLLASRSFNAISVEPVMGVLRKSSANVAKFTQEIDFIRMLPESVAPFFSRLLSPVTVNDGRASVAMEYYGYPTVAELALFWDLDEPEWERLFHSLEQVLRRFRAHHYELGQRATQRFYGDRVRDRVHTFLDSLTPNLRNRLNANELQVNGKTLRGFDWLWPALAPRIAALYDPDHFCVMHGDFCFNNILYDPYSATVRLIDARGSFGDDCVGIYGDQKYDLAKLAHSAIGQYDYFVSNLFRLVGAGEQDSGAFTYQLSSRKNQPVLERLMLRMTQRLGYATQDVMLITGLLFLSMTPLHADDHQRQIALYLHGLTITQAALGVETTGPNQTS